MPRSVHRKESGSLLSPMRSNGKWNGNKISREVSVPMFDNVRKVIGKVVKIYNKV